MTPSSPPYLKYLLFVAFALSGFSGLIYESVWTSYLKFFLGHAAYAQALVLAMFMGGMAVGAWLSSRTIAKTRNPLIAYAAIEILIGIFGLGFHQVFVAASSFMYGTLLPGVEAPWAVELVRWGMAAALIFIQTLLLGATFPLMSVGVLRAFPGTPGSSISMLYFTNSMGAVVGVLCSGFILIGAIGLPGTVLAAGIVNVLLAIVVYGVGRKAGQIGRVDQAPGHAGVPLMRPMLLVAMVTGLSSFIYEISWIRMLSMITGASTHAFELMLSAFILGLALGGFWLRKRIDRYREPLFALGVIQLVMGILALSTVLLYNPSLEFMSGLYKALRPNDHGYLIFNLSGYAISMALMLPTTFMAGMTLPLITLVLYKQGGGEAAVGKVYAMNTLGAIAGIILAAMLLLPLFGLKAAILIGAGLDLLLALYLFSRSGMGRLRQAGAWSLAAVVVLICVMAPPFDSARMASGIFRGASSADHSRATVLLHRDGRTATVDVIKKDTRQAIITNGKTDAAAEMGDGKVTPDEPTMVMLGALPQLLIPNMKHAAMIGMGAGMSADVMLMSKQLQRLDVIEIEAGMVEGARLFAHHSARVFSDPRSHIHIDDAKSYFSSHKKRYDVIVSEPSDTWVSGVSTLFTEEFYARIRNHLNEEGMLVQWVATYGSNAEIFASIMKALGNNFSDYRLYATTDKVVVIVAKVKGKLPELSPQPFADPVFAKAMERIGLPAIGDVQLHELGDRAFFDPLFRATAVPVNSDYFPYVDQNANQARYKETSFNDVTTLFDIGIPVPGRTFDGTLGAATGESGGWFSRRSNHQMGRILASHFPSPHGAYTSSAQIFTTTAILRTKPGCGDGAAQHVWQSQAVHAARRVIPATTTTEAQPMLSLLRDQLCETAEGKRSRMLVDLIAAVAARNMPATEAAALKLIANQTGSHASVGGYAYNALLLAYFKQEKWLQIQVLFAKTPGPRSLFADVVHAHAVLHMEPTFQNLMKKSRPAAAQPRNAAKP
jgi:spermidine synthase